MTIVVVLAIVTAAAAAVRGTWSPCGLSMLSTVTPLAEAGRGRRWTVTARWFVAGAVLGGLTLGALIAEGLAAVVGALGVSTSTALGIATVAALVCAASDLDPFGLHIPFHGRQVNERWLDQYRAWVYGGGFGWQIGCGLATYITTAAMYLTIVLTALTGDPLVALAIGAGFGLVRGMAIYTGRSITTTDRLLAVHRRFGALRRPVRLATIGVMFAVGVVAAGAWAGLTGALAAGAATPRHHQRSPTSATATTPPRTGSTPSPPRPVTGPAGVDQAELASTTGVQLTNPHLVRQPYHLT